MQQHKPKNKKSSVARQAGRAVDPLADLKIEYRRKMLGCTATRSREYWRWFLAQAWKRVGRLGIFREVQTGLLNIHATGTALLFGYVQERATHRQIFDAVRSQVFDAYAQGLIDNGVVSGVELDSQYYEMTEDLGLQVVKAFKDLRGTGIVPSPTTCPTEIATPAATIWYRFVSLLHARWGLPAVSSLDGHVYITRPYERAVFDSGVFDTYELTARERTELEELVGLNGGSAVPIQR